MAGQPKSESAYGSYGSVPNASPNIGATPNLSVRATPQEFGAQVGQAVEGAGKEGFEIANKFATMATEARANDDYANKYVPAALQLKNKYDLLDSQDKVHGYQEYVGGLQDLNKQFSSSDNGSSILYQQHMSSLINKHIEGEESAANNELVRDQLEFSQQAKGDLLLANSTQAAANYNNPGMVKSLNDQNDGLITLQHMDAGHDPTNPQHQEIIQTAQDQQKGNTAIAMVGSAISRGDVAGAHAIRSQYSDVIPGDQQLHLDNVTHQASMNEFGNTGVHALTTGQVLPNPTGYAPRQVQATVADTAQAAGQDANELLTVTHIESSDGKNLGTGPRATIGGTLLKPGSTVEDQAKDMSDHWAAASTAATKALGRPADSWEKYICYQQGSTGGATLLKGAQNDPDAKAVDLLTPVYGDRQTAMSAIVKNGGNVTMTSGDFLSFIQQKYKDNAQRAQCDTPTANLTGVSSTELGNDIGPQQQITSTPAQTAPKDVGDAIRNASTITAPAVQPAATPIDQKLEFDKKYAAAMNVAVQQPNGSQRKALISYLKSRKEESDGQANVYKEQIVGAVQKQLADPNFKSMEQLSPETSAVLAANFPTVYQEAERRADANRKYGFEQASRITNVNGPNFYDNIQRSLADNTGFPVPNTLHNNEQLHGLLAAKDETYINLKDYQDLKDSFKLNNGWKRFLSTQMETIKNANGNVDGQGTQRASDFYFKANQMKDQILKDGKQNIDDLSVTDSTNPIMKLATSSNVSAPKQLENNAKEIQNKIVTTRAVPASKPNESPAEYLARIKAGQ